MNGTAGTIAATGYSCSHLPAPSTPIRAPRGYTVLRNWITTAHGPTLPITAMSGIRPSSARAGLRTAMAAGSGWIGMDGLGSATIPGAGRHFTTDAGSTNRAWVGVGIRVSGESGAIGRRRWWGGSDMAPVSASVSVSATSVGWRWRLLKRSTPGGAADSMAAETSIATLTLPT